MRAFNARVRLARSEYSLIEYYGTVASALLSKADVLRCCGDELPDSCAANDDLLDGQAVEWSRSATAAVVAKQFKASGEAAFRPKLPGHPVYQSPSAMPSGARPDAVSSTLGELRRAHQAGLHRDVGEVRGGDDLLVAICRRGETAEHGDDLDHDRRRPSLAPQTVRPIGALSYCSLTGSAGGKMLSYTARASRTKRARSRSDFGTNRIVSLIFAPQGGL